jgi:hypothetical protein
MKNLATTNQSEVTILSRDEVYISQRKLADLCGVEQPSIAQRCLSQQYEVSQGVAPEIAILLITYYAVESKAANDTARKSLSLIAKAGMKAYILALGGYTLSAELPTAQQFLLSDLFAAQKVACETLRLPESGSLLLLQQLNQKYGNPIALPAYGVDNGGTVSSGSSRPTFSATYLLKHYVDTHGRLSATKFNDLAIAKGLLETLSRPSSTKGEREYKSITGAGQKFGKNLTNPNNQKETQPHWYSDTFEDLLNILTGVTK